MKKTVRTIEYTWEEKTNVLVERQHRSTIEMGDDKSNVEEAVSPGELQPVDADQGDGENA